MSLIPHANVNVFLLSAELKALLLCVWVVFSATEAYKGMNLASFESTEGVSIPCKCAPILYLPYQYWYVVAAVVAANIYTIYKTKTGAV
jgi:hypothetical protein